MNKERILALADLVESQPHSRKDEPGFNMDTYAHVCGTPSCIAGWAQWEAEGRPEVIVYDGDAAAVEYLGINQGQADKLFLMVGHRETFYDVTPSQAAATLRHFAETGQVDWSASPLPADNGRAG